jgi:hypothetical protein
MTGSNPHARRALMLALLVVALLGGGCATTRVVYPPAAPARPPAGLLDGFSVATTALAFQGVPYRLGGTDPSGFDCSGLVQYVLSRHGRPISRLVKDQYEEGRSIDEDELRPGDLVFFRTSGNRVSHVGIAIGEDRFVHAPSSRGVVRVESLDATYWRRHYAGARRVE